MKLIGLYPSDTYQHLHKAYAVTLYLIFMLPPTILGLLRFVFAQELTSFDYNDFMMVEKTATACRYLVARFCNEENRVLYYHVYVILILGLVYASFACDLAIKNCIRHHQTIINFVYEYQNASQWWFSVSFRKAHSLSDYSASKSVKSTLELDIYFLIAMNYLSLLFFQIFFYCYYGTLLIEESKTLPTAVYMSRWYEYNIQTKKTLNILMERSKRPMVVTAGKLFDLSLDTFTTVLKRAYSLVAVLGNY
ncbi:hypothetical protein Zmor_002380 [Zophobas morio]|uniref:Uncharacterized protein n=1 Tax=Zophobas morio TaxID=2755281 RepID=A0AA38J6C6_9CUCU|nr:hypothetical protein Zmor_002380 [Zophobas morio]